MHVLCVIALIIGMGWTIPAVHQQKDDALYTRLNRLNPTQAPPPSLSKLGKFRRAGVSTHGEACAAIGRSVLEKGGGAVDAAIAILFCSGVAAPESMGLGGGFLMVVYDRDTRTAVSLNARETAPGYAHINMFHGNSTLSQDGPLSIAVPGEVKGYWEAHKRFGKLRWSEIIQPTIQLCKEGIKVSTHLANALRLKQKYIKEEPSLREIFLNPKTQEVWTEGDIVKRPRLAETLQILSEKGGDELYTGELGKKLVADIQQMGGNITEEDLANYRVKWERPISVHLRDNISMYSVPPPGSGAILGYILNILDGYNFSAENLSTEKGAIVTYHRIAEAFKHAYGKRTQMGDPTDPKYGAHILELVANMTSKGFGSETRKKINDSTTYNDPSLYGASLYEPDDHGTAHICVLASNGDAVSATSTINRYFGAKLRSVQTGIILNNEMDDFSYPRIINSFGVPPSPANFITPGKQPLSSMSATIFVDGRNDAKLITGGAGGTRITTSTAYVSMRNMWFNEDIKTAIDYRRIHHQLLPMKLYYEYGFLDQYVRGLEALGHKTERREGYASVINGIARAEDGFIYTNADYRGSGSIDGY